MFQRILHSIQGRLLGGLTLTLLLMLLLLWWLLSSLLQTIIQQQMASRMQHDAEAVLLALQTVPWQLDHTKIASIYHRPRSGHYFQITTAQHEPIRSRSLWDEQLPADLATIPDETKWIANGPFGQEVVAWSNTFLKQQRQITITVAEDSTPSRQMLATFNTLFALVVTIMVLLLALTQLWVVRHSLRSLHQIAHQLQELRHRELQQLNEQVPVELHPLVAEINRLLQQLRQRLERSRNATGNLAHALKTPLNMLRRVAEDPYLGAQPPLQQQLQQQTSNLQHLIERELKRARLSGQAMPGQFFYPATEMPLLQQLLQRIYPDKQIKVTLPATTEEGLPFDRDDMLELLGNLLDNGCKWAEQIVHCRISQNSDYVTITIADDGCGCDADKLQLLKQRGIRIDENISGSGLGLAIVDDIVQLYDGAMQLALSDELGGLKITITLPLP